MKYVTFFILFIFSLCLLGCSSKSPCDKFLDGYEQYVNKTIEITKKMKNNPSDPKWVSEYATLQIEASEWSDLPSDCENDAEFLKKFTEIQLRLVNSLQ